MYSIGGICIWGFRSNAGMPLACGVAICWRINAWIRGFDKLTLINKSIELLNTVLILATTTFEWDNNRRSLPIAFQSNIMHFIAYYVTWVPLSVLYVQSQYPEKATERGARQWIRMYNRQRRLECVPMQAIERSSAPHKLPCTFRNYLFMVYKSRSPSSDTHIQWELLCHSSQCRAGIEFKWMCFVCARVSTCNAYPSDVFVWPQF